MGFGQGYQNVIKICAIHIIADCNVRIYLLMLMHCLNIRVLYFTDNHQLQKYKNTTQALTGASEIQKRADQFENQLVILLCRPWILVCSFV